MALVGAQGMDNLVQACHANLNLFVESFLSIIRELIEQADIKIQVQAVDSVRSLCVCLCGSVCVCVCLCV
jgi:hypothetical protein